MDERVCPDCLGRGFIAPKGERTRICERCEGARSVRDDDLTRRADSGTPLTRRKAP